MRTQPFKPFRAVAAFTLVELIVAVGIFAVGASIAYALLMSDFNLYIRNLNVGKSFGLTNDPDLVQVNFTLLYTYRGQNYTYKAMTYKGTTNP